MRKLYLLLFASILLMSFTSAFNWNNSMSNYWRLDEGAGTTSVNAVNASNPMTFITATWGNGIINNGASFATTGKINTTAQLPVNNLSKSVSLWFNDNALTGSQFIMFVGDGSSGKGFNLYAVGNVLSFDAFGNGAVTINSNLQNSTWYHAVLSYNGTQVNTFLNGINTANVSIVLNTTSGYQNMTFGMRATNIDGFNGIIDEIGLWNRTLNGSEVSELYNNGAALSYGDQDSHPNFNVFQNIYNATTYETASESFKSWVNVSDYNISSVRLVYNNVNYTGSFINYSLNNYTFFYNGLDVPSGVGARTWKWSVTLTNSSIFNLMSNAQTVSLTNFSLCAATPQNVVFMNITFKNETLAQERIKASVSSSTINYWLGSGTTSKTLTYSNAQENFSYAFCSSPPDRVINTNISFSYTNTVSQARQFNTNLVLTNSSSNINLFLLPTSSGQQVSFQVQTVGGSRIPGVVVNATRSGYGFIDSKITDDAGIVTLFLDPTGVYTINAFKQGYPLSVLTITPTQTSYTIVLGSNATTITDYSRGVRYFTAPSQVELNNNTNYAFNFTIFSTYSGLSSYGFFLEDYYGNTLASASGSNSAGGSAYTTYNVGNLSFIAMNYFWVINGTYNNGSTSWIIINSADTGWSVGNVFSDLRRYLNDSSDNDGLFGLKMGTTSGDFSLAIVIFLVIFSFGGIMSYKYGLSSGGAILAIIFTGVLLFDVGLGIVPNPIGAVPHFPTFFMAIILVGEIIREAIT